jgi:citrate lyase gamma subunit
VINGGSPGKTWERYTDNPITGNASASIWYSTDAHDDWLITPPLNPVPECNVITFKAKQDNNNYIEKFNVKLSTTGNNKGDFTITLASNVGPAGTVPEFFTYDLSDYNGQTVYFAIQAISTDEYGLIVDDFSMSPTNLVVTGGNKEYRLIPTTQLDSALTLKTTIENLGNPLAENVNVTATLKDAGSTTLFSSTDVLSAGLGAGEIQTVSAATSFDATTLAVGNYSYTYAADYTEDHDPTDNTDVFNFSVTDYIYARDAGEFAETGIGGNAGEVTFGNLFDIVREETISGVQFVWPATLPDNAATYQLALYKLDDAENMNVTETVFTTKTYVRIQSQAGQTMSIVVSPKLIQPGLYVLAIKQTSGAHIQMAYDKTGYGFLCVADDAGNPTKFEVLQDFGNVSLRMDFTPKNTVTFAVTDGTSPMEGAVVNIKQGETALETIITDSAGKAEIHLANGDYSYTLKIIGYKPKSDVAFTISRDTTIDVEMEIAPPTLEITPDTFTFEETQFATSSAPQTFTMQNIGTGTITIDPSDITITGADADQFALINIESTVNLGTGETASFTVIFAPTTVGEKTATIKVDDNGTIREIIIKGNAVDYTVTEFPYKETFDGKKFPPSGWLSLGEEPWIRVTTGGNPACDPFGAGMLKYNCWDYYSGSQGTLVSRRLDIGSGTYGVGFKMYRDDEYSDAVDKVEVYINTQANTTGATLLGTVHRNTTLSPAVSEEGWYDYVFEIPNTFVENPSYVLLVATSDWGNNIFVDEFTVAQTSTVTLISNPGEGGILTGGGSYIVGTGVNLKATANPGYKFINWTNEANEVVSTAETYNYVVGDSNVTFTADFEQLTTVTFTIVDAENDPIEGATAAVKQGEILVDSAVSNFAGEAVIYAANGDYTYSVTALGYSPKNDVLFTINGDTAINVQLDELPPALEITPDTFSFEPTQFGTSSDLQIFILQNIGGGTVTINPSDITITGDNADQFILTTIESTVNLDAGETANFTVIFTPDTIGEKTAIIQVNDNLENIHEIVINGSAVDFTITEFPYTESFDGETFPPLGWLSLGEKPWERVTSGSNPTCDPFGAGMLKYNCWSYKKGNQGTLVSRRLDMGSGTYGVGFKMYRDNYSQFSSKNDKVEIFVNTQPDTIIDATKLGTINRYTDYDPTVSEQGWYDYVFEIPATFVESPSYIILVATSDYGTNIFVDEFVVGQVRAVTLAANPSEGGSVAGGGSYLEGTEATLTATPNAGYVLTSWTDAANEVVSKKQTFNYLVGDSDVTFTANFELGYTVTFTVIDAESNPVEGASIVINEETLTTDSLGVATIELVDGTYSYTISKLDFVDVTGTATVSAADLSIDITIQTQIYAPFNLKARVINGNQIKLSWNPGFADDMESYEDFIIENIGNYTLIDLDGTQTYGAVNFDFPNEKYTGSYIVFNPSAATPAVTQSAWDPYSGDKYLACFAANPLYGGSNNDWLITPQVTVVPGMRFSFRAKSVTDEYGLECFKVGVSTTDTEVSSFTFLTGTDYMEAPAAWTQYTYDLNSYVGEQIYLAINCVSDDTWVFLVDDIYIGGPQVGEPAVLTGFNIYLDGVKVATDVTTTEYTIPDLTIGNTYTLGVQSVYGSDTSEIVTTSFTVYQTYTVTFAVVDAEDSPVEGANIVIDEDMLTTDSSGVASIDLAGGDYTYTVSKPGYADFTGSFTVTDTVQTIHVNLTTGMDKLATGSVRLYPNPVKNTLIIEHNTGDEFVIELYSISGLLVGTTKAGNRTTAIDVGALSSGSYFVRIIGTNSAPTMHRFIKQ